MKLLEQNYKQISYFGLPLIMPKSYKWIATDADGKVYGYVTRPSIPGGTLFWSPGMHINPVYLGRVDLNGLDWRDTAVEVE